LAQGLISISTQKISTPGFGPNSSPVASGGAVDIDESLIKIYSEESMSSQMIIKLKSKGEEGRRKIKDGRNLPPSGIHKK